MMDVMTGNEYDLNTNEPVMSTLRKSSNTHQSIRGQRGKHTHGNSVIVRKQ